MRLKATLRSRLRSGWAVNHEEMQCLWREYAIPAIGDRRTRECLAAGAGPVPGYPPTGGLGITECRTPYFTV